MAKLKKPKPSSYNPGKQERSQRTFEDIVKAGTLILRDTPDKFTTNRIAEKAGISIGHLYQFFPNKDSILDAIFERELEQDRLLVEKRVEGAKLNATRAAIALVMEIILEVNSRHPRLRRAMWMNLGGGRRQELLRETHLTNVRKVAELLKRCEDWEKKRDPMRLSLIMLSSYMAVLNFNNEVGLFEDRELVRELGEMYGVGAGSGFGSGR